MTDTNAPRESGAELPQGSRASLGLTSNQAAVAAFLVAGVVLALQILIHRIVSAKLLSTTFGISGLLLSALPIDLAVSFSLPAGPLPGPTTAAEFPVRS